MSNDSSTDITLRGEGLDCIDALIVDKHIRPITVDGEVYASLVDLMAVFGQDNRQAKSRSKPFNARIYWSKVKRGLLGKDVELYNSVIQLKSRAQDGKMRSTDFAPLWACVFVVLLMNTNRATEFKKRLAKLTAVEIKYRMMNVAHGLEWAADTIQVETKDLDLPESDSAWQELGYNSVD